MLLEFTVENYRSFYRKKTLVLEADKALKECTETNFLTSSLRHPKRQDGQTMASMTDVRVSAS